MFRDFMPRLLIYPLIAIFVINLGAIYSRPPVHVPQYAAMVKLLQWHDPVSGQQLNLPIDRSASINEQIVELQKLEYLHLADNQLTEIPPEIGNLTNLLSLSLSNNQLSKLPSEIGNLTELRRLWVHNNQLSEVPS